MLFKYFIFMMWASFVCAMDPPHENDSQFSPKTIELHLMWLNEAFSPDQKGLFRQHEEETHTKIIADAVTHNTDIFSVTVLYNSHTTSIESLLSTQNNIVSLLNQRTVRSDHLSFKDMWEIPYIKTHAVAFDENNPIYFVSDLARVAVLCDTTTSARYKVYADLNILIKSMSSLFEDTSPRGLATPLEKYGFALSKNQAGDINYGYENAFLALDTENKAAVHAFHFAILDMNVRRAAHFKEQNLWKTWSSAELKNKIQSVFTSFKPMFSYHRYLMGEYGIEDDQKNMPKTLERRILRYPNPQELFDFMNGSFSKVTYKYGKDAEEKEYKGYQLAGKMHHSGSMVDHNGYINIIKRTVYLPSMTSGREYTVDVGKPISRFY